MTEAPAGRGPVRRLAGDGHHAEQRLRQQVLAGLVDIGPVGAVARGRGVDQAGLARLQALVAEAQLLHHARPEVLGHHVGAVDELQRDLAAAGRLQVEGDAALVAVGGEKEGALAVVPDVAAGPMPLPGPIRALDRDDVGAEVGQHLDAHGAEQKVVEADHAHAARADRAWAIPLKLVLTPEEHRTAPIACPSACPATCPVGASQKAVAQGAIRPYKGAGPAGRGKHR